MPATRRARELAARASSRWSLTGLRAGRRAASEADRLPAPGGARTAGCGAGCRRCRSARAPRCATRRSCRTCADDQDVGVHLRGCPGCGCDCWVLADAQPLPIGHRADCNGSTHSFPDQRRESRNKACGQRTNRKRYKGAGARGMWRLLHAPSHGSVLVRQPMHAASPIAWFSGRSRFPSRCGRPCR